MYAVIRAGGKQYKVAPGDVIRVEKLSSDGGDTDGKVKFSDVLAVSAEAGKIGKPGGEALVTGEVLEQGRGAKISSSITRRKSSTKSCAGTARSTARCASQRLLSTGSPSRLPNCRRKKKKVKKAAEAHEESHVAAEAKPAKKKTAGKATAKKSTKTKK